MKQKGGILLVMGTLWTMLFASIWLLIRTLMDGTQVFDLLSFHLASIEVSLAFRFDSLSAPLFAMVATLAIVIGHYSVRYLSGELKQGYFFKYLLGLILSVSSLVLANNLLMFFTMWVLTSYNLHKLLLFYDERPNARAAAIKKQIVSRLGDVAILGAVFLIYQTYGTTDLSELFAARPSPDAAVPTEWIGLLLAVGAITKSAQFPFHSWLPETMETPTPVSALMHAGVINAGGFLIIRFSPILENAVFAHTLLIVIGALTAVYGSLVMVTQNNIKSKLAFSTIAQMGIMLFACGMGAYGIALFHIIAHSFYKSHAFLSTGQLIEESKKVGFKLQPPTTPTLVAVVTLSVVTVVAGYLLWDGYYFAVFAYGSVMMLALAQSQVHASELVFDRLRVFGATAALMIAGLMGYALIEYGMAEFLSGTVPSLDSTHSLALTNAIPIAFALALFVWGFISAGHLMNPKSDFYKKIYMYLWNGGYFSSMTSRWTSKLFLQTASAKKA